MTTNILYLERAHPTHCNYAHFVLIWPKGNRIVNSIFNSVLTIIAILFLTGCVATSGDIESINTQISSMQTTIDSIAQQQTHFQQRHNENWRTFDAKASQQATSIANQQTQFQQHHNENWKTFDAAISEKANSVEQKHLKFEQVNDERWNHFASKYDSKLRAELR